MANTVIQLIPVDPSLATNPDFAGLQEFIINGTYYVADTIAKAVYEWANNTPGPQSALTATNSSYSVFQAFLAANPPVIQTNTASYPAVIVPQNEQTVLLRGILMALIQLATSGNPSDTSDYYPLNAVLS
jgi:hypothetical protein